MPSVFLFLLFGVIAVPAKQSIVLFIIIYYYVYITEVYIIFLISAQNIDYGYSLEPPRQGGSNEYPPSMFWAEIWNTRIIYLKIFLFGL